MFRNLTPFLLHFFDGEGAGGGTGDAGGGGTDGNGGEGDKGEGGSAPPKKPETQSDAGKTFTQAQVDRIAGERARREREQFADYEDLKAKAAKYDEEAESRKTDEQKAKDAREKQDRETAAANTAANRRLIVAEIKAESAGRVQDVNLVARLLADDASIKVRGDSVEGAKEALDALLTEHPYLEKKAGPGGGASGGEFNGRDMKTLDEQIAAAVTSGDIRLSTRLKMQKARSQQA